MLRQPRFGGQYISAISGPIIATARNRLVREFLKSTNKWALFVDSDLVFTSEQVDALYAKNAPLVNGVYASSSGVIQIEGAGFMLVAREVFETIGERWFDHISVVEARAGEDTLYGEDTSFFRRAQDAGFTPVHAEEIRVGHQKVVTL